MITPYPCPTCQAAGCANCNNVGFFGRDEHYDYYLTKEANGNVRVAGIKESGSSKNLFSQIFSFFFKIISKQLEEPHDFLWAIKQRGKS